MKRFAATQIVRQSDGWVSGLMRVKRSRTWVAWFGATGLVWDLEEGGGGEGFDLGGTLCSGRAGVAGLDIASRA